jgi:ubiquinone/menaquinone biosynthesis C-methylase UbiE
LSNYKNVYREQAELYDELVAAEDVDGNLSRTLLDVCDIAGATVVEAGAGTGRLTRLMLEAGASRIIATEIEPAMLAIAEKSLAAYAPKLECLVADARSLPVEDNVADIAIAGWVFGHFRSWMPENWQNEVGAAVSHLERVTRAGGTAIVIETLGTGTEVPAPAQGLLEYYQWLEDERGFVRTSIRTDYLFESVQEAERVTGAFFGNDFAANVREQQWRRVPECTGVWTRSA